MRLINILVLAAVACVLGGGDAVARKKKAVRPPALPESVSIAGTTGGLTSFSFIPSFGKKNGGPHTSLTLSCRPGFVPMWQTDASAESGVLIDYFGCIPHDAVYDWTVAGCAKDAETCEGQFVFTTHDGRPLSLATYEVASFRRPVTASPLCKTLAEVRPDLAFPEEAAVAEPSAPGAVNCFRECAQDQCRRTVLYRGILQRVGG